MYVCMYVCIGPWQTTVDSEASLIIPVPAPYSGVIVVASSTISYIGDGRRMYVRMYVCSVCMYYVCMYVYIYVCMVLCMNGH